mmetsp:Transcript_10062/g.22514  ORF Transcript_10062/g.22514 Transcript_10062/m.22514 type:complete len:346 (+) Transcript_10062:229-1266(+)
MQHWISALIGILLAYAASRGHHRYRIDISDAYRKLNEDTNTTIAQTACGPIQYAIRGPDDGIPILVIHGLVGGFDQGLVVAADNLPVSTSTGNRGYRAIVPSRFGYLGTPLPKFNSDDQAGNGVTMVGDQADAYVCLLDSLDIHLAVPVIAVSAGSTSALQFALRHPERCSCLVLISPNSPSAVRAVIAPPPRLVSNILYKSDLIFWAFITYFRSFLISMMGVPYGFELIRDHEAAIDRVIGTILPVKPRSAGILFDLYVSNPAIDTLPLEEVGVRGLIVNAVDDPLALYEDSKAMAEQMDKGRLLTVEDGGHMMLGHGEIIRNAIGAFLEEVVGTAVQRHKEYS